VQVRALYCISFVVQEKRGSGKPPEKRKPDEKTPTSQLSRGRNESNTTRLCCDAKKAVESASKAENKISAEA
jgi:hypothetical protein